MRRGKFYVPAALTVAAALLIGATASFAQSMPWAQTAAPAPAAVTPLIDLVSDVEIEIDDPGDGEFEVTARFTLGAGNNGIDPPNEAVSVTVGTFSVTIPTEDSGSFELRAGGSFQYEGEIDRVELDAKVRSLGGGSFKFEIEGSGADLSGTALPVTVGITIGDDSSSGVAATARLETAEGEFETADAEEEAEKAEEAVE